MFELELLGQMLPDRKESTSCWILPGHIHSRVDRFLWKSV